MKDKSINVLLVSVNFMEKWNKLDLSCKENLAIASLSAFLKANGYNVIAINATLEGISNETILEKYKDMEFNMIGVSCSSQKMYVGSKDFIIKAHNIYPKSFIIMGGVFATLSYREILDDIPQLDAVSLGEGEYSLLAICKMLENEEGDLSKIKGIAYRKNKKIEVQIPQRISNLDDLPFPERNEKAFSHINGEVTAYVIAGKGCYGSCSYCSIQKCFNYHNRICRSAKRVVDEIEILVKKYGVTNIQFHDDIFYNYSENSQKWLYQFIEEVKRRNLFFSFRIYLRPNDVKEKEIRELKKIGLKTVFIGAESGVQRILDEMNKNVTPDQIKEAVSILSCQGVHIHLGFITLIPTMTFEELLQNYQFLYSLGADVCNDANLHNRLNIYNGCEYEDILSKLNLLEKKDNFWEIHSYHFADKKVQIFHDRLQDIKEYARNTKVLENKIIRCSNENNKRVRDIQKYGVIQWMNITKMLLEKVMENKCDELEDIYDYINQFEQYYRQILKEN